MIHWKSKTLLILISLTFHPLVFASSDSKELSERLEKLVAQEQSESGLVSLGIAVSRGNNIVSAVAGERQIDSHVPVTIDDKWHLGSITKSITATMIARLVEKNILKWDTRIGDVFKDHKINTAWNEVTLHMLLTHTSGASANFPWSIQALHPQEGANRKELRLEEVLKILQKQPDNKPGSDFEYSNVGYTVASVMAAIKTGQSWENLVREEVFQLLGLESGGFGPPVDKENALGQPVGHKDTWFSGPEPVTTETDNSPIMGPAGSIHLSLSDLSKYANEHLLGSQGKSEYLQKSTFDQLHEMGAHDYAYGWIAAQKTNWANNHKVMYHNGSNTFWYALLVMVPEYQLSIAVTTNDGNLKAAGKSAWRLVREIGEDLVEDY